MTELLAHRDVTEFVAAVRARLADLTEDEREELVGGLEADLTELVDDKGVDALGDPAAYAEELRLAAGLAPTGRLPRSRRPIPDATNAWLDMVRDRFVALMERPAVQPAWDLLVALRPAWWLVRAWAAVSLLLLASGRGEAIALVPEPGNDKFLGYVSLAVATVFSVQIGRGVLWPGGSRGALARLVLIGLNTLAVIALPYGIEQQRTGWDERVAWEMSSGPVYVEGDPGGPGLSFDGQPVINVFPYDAEGKPLTGVQLFNENGQPLSLREDMATVEGESITYPWVTQGKELFNVFPLPVGPLDLDTWSRLPSAWDSTSPPALPVSPVTSVPVATLPVPRAQ